MTTELTPPSRPPRPRISPIELRLYLVTLLAAVYAITWRVIGGHTSAPAPAATAAVVDPPPAPASSSRVQAPASRPQLRAVRSPARTAAPAPPRRRAVRVRTRSS